MYSQFADAFVSMVQFAIFCFVTLVATIIILTLTIIFGWTLWFLSAYVVSSVLAWLINRRIV